MYTIRTKELEKNKNIVLSIMNDKQLVNVVGFMDSNIILKEGNILSDKALFRILKYLDVRNNIQRDDKKINQWVV